MMMLGLLGSEIIDCDDHMIVRTSANPTYYWGNFLAVARPLRARDGGRWLKVFEAEFPTARHLAIAVDGTTGRTGRPSEVRVLDATIERSAVLTADELQPPTNQALEVRQLHNSQDWMQLQELRRACDERPNTDEQQSYHEHAVRMLRVMSERAAGAWFGAFVDDRMRAGLGVFSDGSGVARYQHVETQPEFRRRGLATALLRTAGQYALNELGARTLVIVADPAGVAISLYRSVGFRDAEVQVQLIREPVG